MKTIFLVMTFWILNSHASSIDTIANLSQQNEIISLENLKRVLFRFNSALRFFEVNQKQVNLDALSDIRTAEGFIENLKILYN